VCRVGTLACVVPIEHVVETMRPLPLETVGRAETPWIAGVAVIRGGPVPVVDVATLLGVAGGEARRFVVLRVESDRRVALRVDDVVGVRRLAPGALSELPPLLRDVARETVARLGALDRALVAMLDASHAIALGDLA
jgi:purine-binding chemotaxis protein CheW